MYAKFKGWLSSEPESQFGSSKKKGQSPAYTRGDLIKAKQQRVTQPSPPECFDYLIEWFHDVGPTMDSLVGSKMPLSYSEVRAFRSDLLDWEAKALVSMSRCFLHEKQIGGAVGAMNPIDVFIREREKDELDV